MDIHSIKVACSSCNLRELCMPVGLNEEQLQRIDEVVAVRRKVKRGGTLFRNGESFTSLYAIRTGLYHFRHILSIKNSTRRKNRNFSFIFFFKWKDCFFYTC